MKQKTSFSFLVTILVLLVTFSCKSQEGSTLTSKEVKISYPANEIPVNTTSQEALKSFINGLKDFHIGNERKARTQFDAALQMDPNFVHAQIYRLFNNSSVEDWSIQWKKLKSIRDRANPGEALLVNIIEANNNGNRAKVEDHYKSLEKLYPKSSNVHHFMGRFYRRNDETEKARAYWEKAIELNPANIVSLTSLGRNYVLFGPKDFRAGEKYLKKVTQLIPGESQAYINLGDAYRAQDKLNLALENYLKGIQLNPNDDIAHVKAGHASNMLGNYQDARMYYTEARKVSEFGNTGNNHYALTYLYEGDHKKAMNLLLQNIDAIDALDIPTSNKNLSKYSSTSVAAEIAMHFNNTKKLKSLVTSLKSYSAQFMEEAESSVSDAYQIAYMTYWDGLLALTSNNFKEAEAKAAENKAQLAAINDPTKLREYHFLMGRIHYEKGNFKQAKDHLVQSNTDYVYNKYWLAKTYEKLGNNKKANSLFDEVKSENFNSVGNALVKNELRAI